MAINLLSPSLKANTTAASGTTPYKPNNVAGFGGMSVAPKVNYAPPMGVTAVTPTAKAPPPPTVLPKPQQNPIVSSTVPTTSTTPPVQTPPQTQYNTQGQSIGTQLPGMAGFNPQTVTPQVQPQTPVNTGQQGQTTVYQNGQPTTFQNGTFTPVSPTTQTPTTFSGLLGAAVNQQNSPYNQSAQAGITGLQNTATTNPGTSGPAYTDYQSAVDNLNNLKTKIATENAGNSLDNVPLDVGVGRQQASQTQYASQLDAAQQAVNQAQAAIGYQIQGTQTQQTGYNEAAGQALTGQGQVQGALQSAAGLAQPNTAAYGQTVFNPVTGQYTDGGGLPANVLQQYAQMAANGQYSAIPSSITSNPVLSAQLNQAAQAINPNYNPISSQAQGAAQASNISTAGTAQTNAYNQVYTNATNAASTYSQQQSAINAIGNQALELMANTPGINPQSSQFLNTKLNQVSSQFSSPQYAAFNTAIQSLQARIGAALQAGEIPTAATSNAQAIANGSLTIGALASTLKQVDAEMSSFVGTQQSLADYAKQQMQGGGSTSAPSSSTSPGGNYSEGSTVSSGGYNFVLQNGKWVAQ